MKIVLSWLKEFVDIQLSIPELARRLTMAGLEVEEIRLVGLSSTQGSFQGHASAHLLEVKIVGLEWDPEKIVVGTVTEVMAHPNADRLVLCRLDDGARNILC